MIWQQKVKHFSINLKGNLVDLRLPIVMGILNVTPDSFYDGGRYSQDERSLLAQAEKHLHEGATLLDIGGYSTRPDAPVVSVEEERRRAVESVALIARKFPEAYLSVDTFRASIAREAVAAGACMINDISGGNLDAQMFETVAALQVPYIMMHMKGTPQTMKQLAQYDDLVIEILDYFQQKLAALRQAGVKDVILDPGFGFAKTIDHNYRLLANLQAFQVLDAPLLVGLSRKSMIYKRLKISPDEALNGTTVLHTVSLLQGASIIRAHDVKEAVQTIQLLNYIHR